jgi:cyclic-di-GMP-binding protein
MPAFDVVNKVDMQEVTNAVNNATKEIVQRYDFKGSKTEVELDRKAAQIVITTEDEMKMESASDILLTHAVRRKIDPACLDFKETQPAGGKTLRREVVVTEGIDREIARKIVKEVKDSKIKVQVSIQGDELRVSGKKRDDLQATIALLKAGDYEIPLQFVNMRD